MYIPLTNIGICVLDLVEILVFYALARTCRLKNVYYIRLA